MADNEFPQELVQRGLLKELMPQHVAFVIDGHRRWAQEHGLTTEEGYETGGRAFEKILKLSATWGIRVVTVFAFSQENFRRPEVTHMILLACWLTS
jgi:ditrans,polycis-polyprenyl diphosphate synthase